jgi:hypothetical protein
VCVLCASVIDMIYVFKYDSDSCLLRLLLISPWFKAEYNQNMKQVYFHIAFMYISLYAIYGANISEKC